MWLKNLVTMRSIAVLLCVVATVSAFSLYDDVLKEEWNTFKLEHAKQYTAEEEQRRMQIYAENRLFIAQHNERFEQGLETYKVASNKFADMSHNEFVRVMVGFNVTAGPDTEQNNNSMHGDMLFARGNMRMPRYLDWRSRGAVTRVKDQGQCGSCWAFSSIAALESHNFIKTGRLVTLSEQNLLDCSWWYGNYGCTGGYIKKSFEYVYYNGGIDTESSYPYRAAASRTCRFKRSTVGAVERGYVPIPYANEQWMLAAVAYRGPVSVTIDASKRGFQFYSHGVFYDSTCSTSVLNHAVLVAGFGTDQQGEYWLVKNSWGANWGDHGYLKMARNRRNNCGIASIAAYPVF